MGFFLPVLVVAADSASLTARAYMEAVAAWDGACQFELANWTAVEEPAAGVPVEYVSIDIPGSCGLQAYEYDDVQLQQHLVEYYSAASQHNIATSEKAETMSNDDCDARSVVKQAVDKFKADMDIMKEKMHRYPACLGAIDKSYAVPRIVALGPYHHDLEHLKQMEEVKHVAAWHCTREGQLLEEMYREFAPIAINARCFYDKDVMAGISEDEFQHMMFFDACFLVQYMATFCSTRRALVDGSLKRFMSPKRNDIFHDVMLLENQLPWTVVDTVLRLMDSSWISKEFVARWRYCMMPHHHRRAPPPTPFIWYEDYTPPHLLGLLRYYIVGRSRDTDGNCVTRRAKKPKNMSFSVSAMDLAEIGITLKANKSLELSDIHLNKNGSVFTELCLAPLSLDRDSASYLINMAAIELCTVDSFGAATADDSAVCSYLLLLANLVCREEEVQELREKGLLQRGGGLTNAEVLAFFSCFQVLRMGPLYNGIMAEIEGYRDKSPMRTELHAFVYTHKKTIAAVITGIGAVLGIIGALLSIKKEL